MKGLRLARLFIVTCLVTAISVITIYASVYVTGYTTVQSRQLNFVGTSYYNSQLNNAISIWNGMGKVSISNRGNVSGAYLGRCLYYDVNMVQYNFAAAWGTNNELMFNSPHMFTLSIPEKISTAAHEVGHALGLNENRYNSNNIMWYNVNTVTTLGTDDRDSYNYLWY